MKLALLSDGHLLWDKPVARLDDIKVTQFDKLRFVLQWCQLEDAILLQAGDLFNRPRSWYLLPEVMDLLNQYKIPFYCIFGQHDTYMYSEKTRQSTSLGILEKAGMVIILGQDKLLVSRNDSDDLVYLWGANYGQSLPDPKNESGIHIGVIHAPIAEQAIYPGQNYMDALTYLKDNPDYDLILCGDIHQKFIKAFKGRYIVNSGPMIRKEATIYNFQHQPGFFVYDTDTALAPIWVNIPHLPADQVLSRSHIEYEAEATTILDEFIGSINDTDMAMEANFIDNLWLFVQKNKIDQAVINELSEVING